MKIRGILCLALMATVVIGLGCAASPFQKADIDGDQKTEWKLLAVVNTKELGTGHIHGSSVTGPNGPLGTYRHLLWIAEDVGQGTFFTEIDVHAAPD